MDREPARPDAVTRAVTRAVRAARALTPAGVRHALPALISLLVFLVALAVLRIELRAVRWHDLQAAAFATPRPRLLLAVALTALNYAVLTGYDLLAFASIGRPLARRRIAVAAFVAYAISHTVGFAALSGASVRYRFYSRWGVTAEEMAQIVVSYSVTFWIGLLALGGVSLAMAPLPLAAIHSTHDEFVPLADVQRVVSAAHEPKRLWIVEAADHRFSDALPELDRRLVEALAWIANPHAPPS